jgi:TonB family protein
MIGIIRQYQQEDFDWRSYRLGVKVTLSSRMEDSKGLEEFLMRDFFKNDRVVYVNPKQMSDLRERGIGGRVIADGEITGEGTVRELVITESPDSVLEKAVVEAILKARFEPFLTKKGQPVPERYRQSFEFEEEGTDRKTPRHTFPKHTEHLPIAFQYDMPPVVRVVTPVVYPLNLLRNNISGSATVAVILDPDGNVQEVHIVKATHPEFGLATRGMMQSWEFEPATKDGLRTWSIFIQEQKFSSYGTDEEITESGKHILRKLKNHASDIHAISALDSLPEALYKPNPSYPSHLSKKGVRDHVVVEFFIDEEGRVQLPHIVKAKNDELAWIAVTAVSRWHFTPPLRHGQPAVARAQLPITFDSSQEGKVD